MKNRNNLLAVIPCVGSGLRVQEQLKARGVAYKELNKVPFSGNGRELELIKVHIIGMCEWVKVEAIVIPVGHHKLETIEACRTTLQNLGYDKRESAFHKNIDMYFNGSTYQAAYIIHVDASTLEDNPYNSVKLAHDLIGSRVAVSDNDWDVVTLFPDIHYDKPQAMWNAILHHARTKRGEFGLSGIPRDNVPNHNPQLFGRISANESLQVTQLKWAKDVATDDYTHLESGILYLGYIDLFKPKACGTWIYDILLENGVPESINVMEIKDCTIIDFGDPLSYQPVRNVEMETTIDA